LVEAGYGIKYAYGDSAPGGSGLDAGVHWSVRIPLFSSVRDLVGMDGEDGKIVSIGRSTTVLFRRRVEEFFSKLGVQGVGQVNGYLCSFMTLWSLMKRFMGSDWPLVPNACHDTGRARLGEIEQ
jgi:hypothetical protein